MNLADAVEAFILSRKSERRMVDTTERTYRHHFSKFVEYLGHDTPIATVSTTDIRKWMSTMASLQPSSLKTAVAPIRALFAWAVLEEITAVDPTVRIAPIQVPKPMYRGLDPGVVALLLHHGDFRERTILALGLHLGLRCCEMSRADVTDWDRRDDVLYVRGKGGRGEITRALPVLGEARWVMDVWIDGRRTGPLFGSQHSDRLQANSISQRITMVAQRAQVKATAHQLRHTCAHDMLAAGSQPNAVQRFLGHDSLDTTTVYLAASDPELRLATGRSYLGALGLQHGAGLDHSTIAAA